MIRLRYPDGTVLEYARAQWSYIYRETGFYDLWTDERDKQGSLRVCCIKALPGLMLEHIKPSNAGHGIEKPQESEKGE